MTAVRSISGGLLASTAFALAAVAAVGDARAQDAFTISQGGWEGGAYAQPGSDAFSHCGISREVSSDLTVVFSLNPRNNLNVGFLRPAWDMAEGAEASVTLDVDGSLSREIGALPASPNLLIVPLGRDAELVDALKRGLSMNASIEQGDLGNETIALPLTGTMAGLTALEQCIQTALDLEIADASAPAVPQPVPGVDPTAPMDRQTLAELLRAAGFEEIRFAPTEQIPQDELQLSEVWQVGPVVGGLHQTPRTGPEVEIDAFGDDYVAVLANRCPGELVTQVSETHIFDDQYALRYDLVECTAEEGAAYVALLFTLDDHHYSAFFHEGDPEVLHVAQEATLRIDQVIRVLAGFTDAEIVDGDGAFPEVDGVSEMGGDAPAPDAPAPDAPAPDAPTPDATGPDATGPDASGPTGETQ